MAAHVQPDARDDDEGHGQADHWPSKFLQRKEGLDRRAASQPSQQGGQHEDERSHVHSSLELERLCFCYYIHVKVFFVAAQLAAHDETNGPRDGYFDGISAKNPRLAFLACMQRSARVAVEVLHSKALQRLRVLALR